MPSFPLAIGVSCAGLMTVFAGVVAPSAIAAMDDPAPPAVVVVPEDSALHVAWSGFSAGQGTTITEFDVAAQAVDATSQQTTVVAAPADATDVDVAGLANGVGYDVTVTAVSSDGTQLAAPPSTAVAPRTVPGQPSLAAVAALDGSVRVSWTPPANDGGAPVTGYVVAAQPSGASVTVSPDERSAVVAGLADGAAASLQVVAVNDAGMSPPSSPAVATPRKPARFVVTSAVKPVAYGTTSTVAAKLVTAGGAPVSGVAVQLRGHAAGSTTWHTLATATSNGRGLVALHARLAANTALALHHPTDAVVTADTAAGLAGVGYRMSGPLRPRAVRVAHPITIAGHVSPARKAGTKVRLQRWSSGAWRTVATGRMRTRSTYRLTWTPTHPGRYSLRAVTAHDALRSGGATTAWHQQILPENAADVAADILHNHRITLADVHESGVADAATALQNVRDVAAGRPARRSAYQNAPGGTTRLNLGLLRAIRAMGARLTITVSEIAGGSHAVDSGHYAGRAVDVTVVDGRSVAAGASYGAVVSICRANGATTIFDPGYDPYGGHGNHVHCGWS